MRYYVKGKIFAKKYLGVDYEEILKIAYKKIRPLFIKFSRLYN